MTVRNRAATKIASYWVAWKRNWGPSLGLAGCLVAVFGVQLFVILVNRRTDDSQIWLANGILLAYLLLVPRWRWPYYLAVGWVAMMLLSLVMHGLPGGRSLLMSGLNLSEVLVSASLLRPHSRQLPYFTRPRYLLRFAVFALLLGPAVAGLLHALACWLFFPMPLADVFVRWVTVDGLGTAAATPACVAIFSSRIREEIRPGHSWIYLILLTVLVAGSYLPVTAPLLALLYPLLLLILVNFGLGVASLATVFAAAAANWYAPSQTNLLVLASPGLRIQFFVGSAMFMLYCVSIVLERQLQMERQLKEVAELHRQVTEYSRDALIISDLQMNRIYVSAAALKMGGWNETEIYAQRSCELVHPDDLPRAIEALHQVEQNNENVVVEVRAQKKGGEYFWVESSLRAIHNPHTGKIDRVLNIVRDISERKQAERKLQEAYNAVEALAVTDALTGLANRRRFDQYLATEWRRSARDRQPLSVLMLDADHFKAYNDTYGHQRGDSCLKQIAEACQDVVSRPGDLVARFGGEEFVVILPNTENAGAMQVAEEISEALRSRRLEHICNELGIVTISIGCATLVPKFARHPSDLIELADKALYRAKEAGRNRVCNGNDLDATPEPAAKVEATAAFNLPGGAVVTLQHKPAPDTWH